MIMLSSTLNNLHQKQTREKNHANIWDNAATHEKSYPKEMHAQQAGDRREAKICEEIKPGH